MFTPLFQLSCLLPEDTGGLESDAISPLGLEFLHLFPGVRGGNKIGHFSLPPLPSTSLCPRNLMERISFWQGWVGLYEEKEGV